MKAIKNEKQTVFTVIINALNEELADFNSREEAEKQIKEYEQEDKANDQFENDYYGIIVN